MPKPSPLTFILIIAATRFCSWPHMPRLKVLKRMHAATEVVVQKSKITHASNLSLCVYSPIATPPAVSFTLPSQKKLIFCCHVITDGKKY